MHDRIRLALSAAGIAVVTLLASGHPIPFLQADANAQPAPLMSLAHEAALVAPVSTEIPIVAEAPNVDEPKEPEIPAPRIRRTAGAEFTTA